jgi:hypothetical protein
MSLIKDIYSTVHMGLFYDWRMNQNAEILDLQSDRRVIKDILEICPNF